MECHIPRPPTPAPATTPNLADAVIAFDASIEVRDLELATTQLQRSHDGEYRFQARIILWPTVVGEGLLRLAELDPLSVTVDALEHVLCVELIHFRPFRAAECPEIIEELIAWFRFLARTWQAPHARECLRWLRAPETLAMLRLRAMPSPIPHALPPLPAHLRSHRAPEEG